MENKVEQDLKSAFEYIVQEKNAYETTGVDVTSNWTYHMPKDIERAYSLKNSKFTKGKNDGKRPFRNIILPIANVNYRTEGFDVKDIDLYVDDADYHHLSLLGRKYYHKWALENHLDTEIDNSVESYFDYGLILAKNVFDKKPEIVPLQRIAFCDQTDILSGPICEKHSFSIDQLLDMKGKWYDEEIDKAILQAQSKKNIALSQKDSKTPSKLVEIYELHGVFPKTWLNTEDSEEYSEEDGYCRQVHFVTFYKSSNGDKEGICLFKGKEVKSIYKALKRTNRFGTATGLGGIEEIFDPQTWANYSEIHLNNMLEAVSKILVQTSDKKLAASNNLSNAKNLQIIEHEEGKPLTQVALVAPNKNAFDNYVNSWEQVARTIGSASDPSLGKNPTSGTPLGTTELVTEQGEGVHDYRKGKIADFWHEIHVDWIMKSIVEDLNKGEEWLDELSLNELQEVARKVATNTANKRINDLILFEGKLVSEEERAMLTEQIMQEFLQGGKQKFLKTMKDEFKKLPLKLKINVAGKQKNMAAYISKLNSVFRTLFTPGGIQAIQQNEGLGELLNNILESAGLSPLNFSSMLSAQPQQMQPQQMPQAQPELAIAQ